MDRLDDKFSIRQFIDLIDEQSVLKDLVERVKKRRKELKITQKDLARLTMISYGSIKRFEQTGEINLYSFLKIARVLNQLTTFDKVFTLIQYQDLENS